MQPTEVYNQLKFKIPVGLFGDCYDRFMLRILEMKESVRIVKQCLIYLVTFKMQRVKINDHKVLPPEKHLMKKSMEAVIHFFKYFAGGPPAKAGESYSIVEAPKGELGVFLKTNGSTRPLRCRIKSPGFLHLQGLDALSRHGLLADMVAVIGSLDLVFGEIDR